MQTSRKQRGFTAIEFILGVLLIGVIAVAIFFAYQGRRTSSTTSTVAATPTPTITPKLSSARLATEKLNFSYPSNWTLKNVETVGNLPSIQVDQATITSPSGFSVSLRTGLDGLGGACPSCVVVASKPITVMGQTLYVNFVSSSGNTSTFDDIHLAPNKNCVGICAIPDKNNLYQDQPLTMLFDAGVPGGQNATLPVSQINTNIDVAAIEAIFSSLKY